MQRRSIRITGTLAGELPDSVYDFLQQSGHGAIERYTGDGFTVIVVEDYQLGTNQDLAGTLVFDRRADEQWDVEIIVGGGKGGLLRLDWGTESNQVDALLSTLEDMCERWGLTIHTD